MPRVSTALLPIPTSGTRLVALSELVHTYVVANSATLAGNVTIVPEATPSKDTFVDVVIVENLVDLNTHTLHVFGYSVSQSELDTGGILKAFYSAAAGTWTVQGIGGTGGTADWNTIANLPAYLKAMRDGDTTNFIVEVPTAAHDDLHLTWDEGTQKYVHSGPKIGQTGFDQDAWDYAEIAFDAGTLEFSITPVGDSFTVYVAGNKYVKDAEETVSSTNVDGSHFFYYDSAGVLTHGVSSWALDGTVAPVAYMYWDSSALTYKVITFAWELHGWKMDKATHARLHAKGTVHDSGLEVSISTDYLNVTPGICWDEDIKITVLDSAGGGLWEQSLTYLDAPVLYREGNPGIWKRTASSTVPVVLDGNVLQYNEYNTGTWSLSNVTVGQYCAYWVIATNDVSHPVVVVPGQEDRANLNVSRNGNKYEDMDFGNLPAKEYKVLARVIVRALAGSPYYDLIEVTDYRTYGAEPSTSSSPQSIVLSESYSYIGDSNNQRSEIEVVPAYYVGVKVAELTSDTDWSGDTYGGTAITDYREGQVYVGSVYKYTMKNGVIYRAIRVKEQQTHVVDASTAHAVTDPADTPATADALRDDLVTNTIPSIESALNALGTKVNDILSRLETLGLLKSS